MTPATEPLAAVLGQVSEEVLIPTGDPAKPRGVIVTPLRAKQFVDILKCVDALAEAGVVEIKTLDKGMDAVKREFEPIKMLMRGGDQFLKIVAIASGLSLAEVFELDTVALVKLASAVWRVNADFFSRHGEELKAALGPVQELLAGLKAPATPQQSHASPTPATA